MEKFSSFIQKAFVIGSLFFVLGLAFGFEYSLNFLGYFLPSSTLSAVNARSGLLDALWFCAVNAILFAICLDGKREYP